MPKSILLLISVSAFFCLSVPIFAQGAQTAVLSLEPSSGNYNVGNTFDIAIKLDTGGNATDGVDIHYLNYNSNLLEAQLVTPGTLYANTNTNNIANGKIDFSQTSSGGQTFNGQGTLATIKFKALTQGADNVYFNFSPGATNDTNVASAGQDVLNSVVNGSYTIQTAVAFDTTAPAKINNLSSSGQTTNSVTLIWTAPGDDGATGQATSYNIRYSTSDITDANFAQATAVSGASGLSPKLAGETESFTVTGLSASTKYYFAIKTSDEVPNISEISNVISATTLTVVTPPPPSGGGGGTLPPSDTTPPATPTEFKAISSETQISLSWKNPKDADFVRVKILRKENKYPVNSTDGQAVYEGNKESFIDKDLTTDKTYYYAIFAYDNVPNLSQAVTLKVTTSVVPQVSEPEPTGPEPEPESKPEPEPPKPFAEMTKPEKITWLKTQIATILAQIIELQKQLKQMPGFAYQDIPTGFQFTERLKIGAKGDEVKYLQIALEIKADGLFGRKTEIAVKSFQIEQGLVADGIVGVKTREELNRLINK